MQSFFTVGEMETRAWSIRVGTYVYVAGRCPASGEIMRERHSHNNNLWYDDDPCFCILAYYIHAFDWVKSKMKMAELTYIIMCIDN